MAKSKDQIISDFEEHISKSGARYYSEWYVGIAADAKSRLFDDHNVSEKNHWWIHRKATSSSIARAVEKYFLDKGADGGPGGGSDNSVHVYGYKKGKQTDP